MDDQAKHRHPLQSIRDHRFVPNAIVRYLLDAGKFDMNDLALMPFSDADRCQFAQLIGYSVCGYSELPYVSDEEYARIKEAE